MISTCAFAVVFFEGWGLTEVIESVKFYESGLCAAVFTRLGRCRGGYEGGGCKRFEES